MLNSVSFQGRLTSDVDLQKTGSDVYYCNFTVAWNKKYKDLETKCFLRCKAWRNTAEFISTYFGKGKEIIVTGELHTEEWEQDGQTRSRTILDVHEAHFCGSNVSNNSSNKTEPDGFAPVSSNDDLPF